MTTGQSVDGLHRQAQDKQKKKIKQNKNNEL